MSHSVENDRFYYTDFSWNQFRAISNNVKDIRFEFDFGELVQFSEVENLLPNRYSKASKIQNMTFLFYVWHQIYPKNWFHVKMR